MTPNTKYTSIPERSLVFWLILSSLLVAVLDGLAAVISAHIKSNVSPGRVFQYIASGLIGPQAYTLGAAGVGLGILLHWLIALFWSAFFFRVYPKPRLSFMKKTLAGVIIGILVCLIMKYVVVPMSLISNPRGTLRFEQVLIHIFLVGMPISFLAARHRQDQRTRPEPVKR